jgi:hypothetical protein
MTTDVNDYPLWVIFLVSIVLIVAAIEVGRRLGVRAAGRAGDDVSTLEGAMLGLLALMIGFTFAIAQSRFEVRRSAVLSEANAIGTTALRARLLPAPHDADVIRLLKDYVQIRLDITRRVPSAADLKNATARSNEIEEALWRQAMALATANNAMVPTGLFIQALNEMIDNQEKHLHAFRSRVPNIVLIALYAVALVATAIAGYARGLHGRRVRLPTYLMGLLIAGVMLLIQDLDRPRSGFIRVSQQPMLDTAAAIGGYLQ